MAGNERERTSTKDVAERLRQLRLALGLNQAQLCRRTGISTTAWNNYERGINRINIDQAVKLKRALGVSLDWVYHGDLSGVRGDVAERLQKAVISSQPTRSKRG